jgi:hypothetical protein
MNVPQSLKLGSLITVIQENNQGNEIMRKYLMSHWKGVPQSSSILALLCSQKPQVNSYLIIPQSSNLQFNQGQLASSFQIIPQNQIHT